MYKWFLAFRYLHTKLIAFFGVASVTLCVAMVLVVISVMGGFLDTIRARARGLHSEIVLDTGSVQGFPYYEEFRAYLAKTLPSVVKDSTPVIYTYGIFRVPATTYTRPARVMGVRLNEYVGMNDFARGLQYERFYPGSTHLGRQPMPVAGITEGDRFRLPEDLEAASLKWKSQERDANALREFEAKPFERTPFPYVTASNSGERVFAAALGPPRYEEPQLSGVIVGCDLLYQRKSDGSFDRYLARGATTTLTLQAVSQSGNRTGEPPVTIPLRYVDDSRTGIYEIDSMCVYVDFGMVQRKLAMDPQSLAEGGSTKARTNQLLVALQPGVSLDAGRDQVAEAWNAFRASIDSELTTEDAQQLNHVDVLTWEDLQRSFINAVEKEKVLVTILFGLISLVAIVLVGCIFYMIVEKKTKDIGILKSLGASASGVGSMFIVYAAAVGVSGAILGSLLGSVFVWNINDFQDFLANLNPSLRIWSPEVYSFDRIPEDVKQADVMVIGIVAILSSMVGSLIPAIIAGCVWPVKALRYE